MVKDGKDAVIKRIAGGFALVGLFIPLPLLAFERLIEHSNAPVGGFENVLIVLWPSSIMFLIDPKTVSAQIFTLIVSSFVNALLYGMIGTLVGFACHLIKRLDA